ncbi:hypothetical protein GGQ81_002482 [Sphingomonas desiccabilis]|nr:hypothetical protein [Sphingomonas desiccabilis]
MVDARWNEALIVRSDETVTVEGNTTFRQVL